MEEYDNFMSPSEIKKVEFKKLINKKLNELFNFNVKCKIHFVDVIHHYESIGSESFSDIFFNINSLIDDNNELIKCTFTYFTENKDTLNVQSLGILIQLFTATPEFNISEPDTYIMIKGLERMIKRYLLIIEDKHKYYLENKKANIKYDDVYHND